MIPDGSTVIFSKTDFLKPWPLPESVTESVTVTADRVERRPHGGFVNSALGSPASSRH